MGQFSHHFLCVTSSHSLSCLISCTSHHTHYGLHNHMNLKRFWIVMSYVLITMFVAKYWPSGNINSKKGPLGKTLVLCKKGFLFCFHGQLFFIKGGVILRQGSWRAQLWEVDCDDTGSGYGLDYFEIRETNMVKGMLVRNQHGQPWSRG